MAWAFDIAPYTSLINILVLILYSLIGRKISDIAILIVALFVLEGIHLGWELVLIPKIESGEDWELVLFLWYFGFAVTDFLMIGAVVKSCRVLRVELSKASKIVLYLHGVMGTLQIIRYLERAITDTDIFADVYSGGIQSMNAVVSALLVLSLIQLYVAERKNKKIWSEVH
ncbi:hypothetical protein [Alteromonas sp. CYL-A6]|uniref:hypothetical protein n=1 Tax=Alteromonas nitratireducens TaxID=3390813 RepID=UPI0034B92D74